MPEPKRDRPLAAVVLAAGQGKRMGASVPKVLIETCGWAMVEHVLEAVAPLGAHPTVVVYGHGGDAVRSALAGRDLLLVHQPEQLGTGHAVQCAIPALGLFEGDVVILCGDTPLLSTRVLRALVEDHRAAGRALTVLSADLPEPGSLGRIVRDASGAFAAIREAADASPEELALHEINTGVIVVDARTLGWALDALRPDNRQGEYYLTDVPEILLRRADGAKDGEGPRVGVVRADDPGAALGVNRPSELLEATTRLRRRILERLAGAGVTIEDPGSTVVDAGVEIGAGTIVRPFTSIAKGARIGRNCVLGPHVAVGPGSSLGDGVRVGAHAELRGVTIEAGARILGPARLVGAVIGSGAWIAPGVVSEGSADGRIVIGDRAHIGAGAVLVAPLTVGAEARVGPGEVVTRDVGAPAATENSKHA